MGPQNDPHQAVSTVGQGEELVPSYMTEGLLASLFLLLLLILCVNMFLLIIITTIIIITIIYKVYNAPAGSELAGALAAPRWREPRGWQQPPDKGQGVIKGAFFNGLGFLGFRD